MIYKEVWQPMPDGNYWILVDSETDKSVSGPFSMFRYNDGTWMIDSCGHRGHDPYSCSSCGAWL